MAQRAQGIKDCISCLLLVHWRDAAPKQCTSVFAQLSTTSVVPSFFSSLGCTPSKGIVGRAKCLS